MTASNVRQLGSARLPPHDDAAERAVLGGLLLVPEAWGPVSALRPADFYADRNALVFEAITALALAGEPIDTTLVRNKLATAGVLPRIGGDEYLLGLTDTIPTVANIEAHARVIREKAQVRRMIHACYEIAALGYGDYGALEDFADLASTMVKRVADGCMPRGSEVVPFVEASHRQWQNLQARRARGEELIGYRTGFELLDDAIGGMVPGDLVVAGGRPGMGKTAFANELKLAVALSARKPVLSFELEMTEEQLVHRIWSTRSQVRLRVIRSASLISDFDMARLLATTRQLSDIGLHFVFKRGLRIDEIGRIARRFSEQHGELGMVVVDYLQRVESTDRRRRGDEQLGEVVRELKTLAGDLHCPVLALSALNRDLERRDDKRPQMSDLRSSGEIESEADTILFLYREELYKPSTPRRGIADIIVGKQRSGDTAETIELRFTKEFTKFENLIRNQHDQRSFEDDRPPPNDGERYG